MQKLQRNKHHQGQLESRKGIVKEKELKIVRLDVCSLDTSIDKVGSRHRLGLVDVLATKR
jgi:hypothetical protein